MEEKLLEIEERLKVLEEAINVMAVGMHYMLEYLNDAGVVKYDGQDPEQGG